ncbi:MAG: acetate--CoA ligase family protein [Desulfomonile tiedjei]|nr:acetate--CoA ligase family protein [Desulfomonile tiedjei]
MKDFFYPSSVVVIGVSSKPMNLGKEIAKNLFEFTYNGVIHFIGPQGGILFGRRIHASLDEIAEPVDLAIILTPARTVPPIMEQCGKKGIRRVVIESGGFGELGAEGHKLGEELQSIAARYGIRFIGPNCIGIMNSANGLVTPFTAMRNVFPKGGVGIIAQSGGVALTFLNMFHGEQLGYSKFAAIGNKLNVDENDLLEYYIDDPETSVVCLYLESIRDGRRLTDIARSSTKPIVVHKANVGSLSRVIAESHTQALANDDMVVDAALRQAGVARFRDLQGYLDFVKILQLPEIRGRNLAIVSRSGGHAVIAADAAFLSGFHLPPFEAAFLDEIRRHLRADVIRLGNPLDLGDLFDFDMYVRILEHTIQQKNVDAILFLHTYFAAIEGEASRKLLQAAASLSEKYNKPIALCVSTEQFEISRLHKEFEFPIYLSPERAVAAMDTAIRRGERRRFLATDRPASLPEPPSDDRIVGDILQKARGEGRSPLLHEALGIVGAAGLPVPEFAVFRDAEELSLGPGAFCGPYAVKVIAAGISHKSDVGGVALGIPDEGTLTPIAGAMLNRFSSNPDSGVRGVLVQQMALQEAGSREMIVGGKRDPQFGPMVLLGYGGIFVEIMKRTSLRMAPFSAAEADRMIDELPGSEIFRGVRGLPALDRDSLKDAILRVAHLMVRFEEIDSIDLNPVLVSPSGVQVLDARIFLRV